jgi:trimeric autotransporter adhesin
MKKTILMTLCVLLVATGGLAQQLKVVREDGQIATYPLTSLGRLTFGPNAGTAGTGDILRVHTAAGLSLFPLAVVDSVTFTGGDLLVVHQPGSVMRQFSVTDVDSVTFGDSAANVVTVTWNGAAATVDNPLAAAGVAVAVTGADVIVTATAGVPGITYVLVGTSTDGMFKIYSDSDLDLRLGGLTLTNANGPAINVQADETITVELPAGTVNTLTDGTTYASPPTGEDQKAAFFSEGQLVFTGTGSLTINGRGTSAHGLYSDDYIDLRGGSVVLASAVKDAVHTNEGFFMSGGSLNVTGQSDGVDAGDGPVNLSGGALTVLLPVANKDGLKCVGRLTVSGGDHHLTIQGNQSKGLKAGTISLNGGTVNVQTSGGMVLVASGLGYDPSYCTAVKADTLVTVDGATLTVTASGIAGRGISSDGDLVIRSGNVHLTSTGAGGTYTDPTGVVDAYTGNCLNADRDLNLYGGTIVLSNSGSGGKGMSGDSDLRIGSASTAPTLQITTTGTKISLGGSEYAEAKAASVDSVITVTSGTITIQSADDALKAKVRIDFNGGLANITNSVEGLEAPYLYVRGGELHVTSTDDGLNTTFGVDGEANDGSLCVISGGYVHLNAPTGDGLDSNGNLTLSGGTLVVHGPPSQPEVGLDVNGTFAMTGGFTAVAQINSNMIEVPAAASSTQRSVMIKTTTAITANTIINVQDTAGNSLLTFKPARNYSAVLFSASTLTAGTTYRIYTGGTCTGTLRDGVYTGGTYSGGTLRTSFTSSSMVQTITF